MIRMTRNATPPPRVLIVEDDAKIADLLGNYLQAAGLATSWCADGLQAPQRVRDEAPQLVLLDLMLPGQDGIAVCAAVRRFSAVPILMLTARVDEIDRLLGLDTGADDYVCKPFSPREVLARVRALLRRSDGSLIAAAAEGGFRLDEAGQRVLWQGRALPLTGLEFRLMRLLLGRPGAVFSRAQLLDAAHSDLRDVSDRAIDSHVKNLRRKLEAAGCPGTSIDSVYGVGYRFDDR